MIMATTLKPQALTAERFALFGDVIETSPASEASMNEARFERFDDLCRIDFANDAEARISIARCRTATALPYRFDIVERHPLGSQAFVPLSPARMIVVVAPPAESVGAQDLCAFETNGRQGINYLRGTWHMPLIAFHPGQEFLIIERGGQAPNCEQRQLDEPVTLAEA